MKKKARVFYERRVAGTEVKVQCPHKGKQQRRGAF